MTNLRFLNIIFIFLFISKAYPQTQIGNKYDLNGQPFFGYFDPFIYSPERKISNYHHSSSFEVGCYYEKNGDKIDGQIKFDDDKIIFKNLSGTGRDKIKLDEIESFVIGVDSFFVTSNFYHSDKLRTEPEFVQFLASFDNKVFAKHYHFTSGLSQTYQGKPSIVETFLAKEVGDDQWDDFSGFNFKKNAIKYFGEIPQIKKEIDAIEFESDNVISLIKMAEYFNKYQNKELIYFDKNWQEISDSRNHEYYAKISNIVDTIWTITYHNKFNILYKIDYSSFYPNVKNGDFTAYNINGSIRQSIEYENNKPEEVKVYDQSGIMQTHFKFVEPATESKNAKEEIEYIYVKGPEGENLINSTNNLVEQSLYDDYLKLNYTNTYRNNKLQTSYELLNGDTIFQMTNPDFVFRIGVIQSKFDDFIKYMDYSEAVNQNAQGIILVSFLVDPKGYIIDYKILNSLHKQLDMIVKSFVLNRMYKDAELKIKINPYKIHKKKQFCEVVIPFEFSIDRFYRLPVSYNNYNYFIMNQHLMYMNDFTPPQVPTFPSHF